MKFVRTAIVVAALAAAVPLGGCDDTAPLVKPQPVTLSFQGTVTSIVVAFGEGPADIDVGQAVAIRVSFLPQYVGVHFVAEPDTDFVVYDLPRDEENTAVIQIGDRTWTAGLRQLLLHNESAIGDRIAVYGTYKLGEYVGTTTFDYVDSTPPFELLDSLSLPSEQGEVGVHTPGEGHGSVDEIGWRVLFSTDEIDE